MAETVGIKGYKFFLPLSKKNFSYIRGCVCLHVDVLCVQLRVCIICVIPCVHAKNNSYVYADAYSAGVHRAFNNKKTQKNICFLSFLKCLKKRFYVALSILTALYFYFFVDIITTQKKHSVLKFFCCFFVVFCSFKKTFL